MQKEIPQTGKPYFNRDLDWLAFNERVLQEAEDVSNPLYERLKFLAIFSSNLDEFFRVRVSKLRQIGKVEKAVRRPLALKPNKTLKGILKVVDAQQERFGRVYKTDIVPALYQKDIALTEYSKCSDVQKAYVADYFYEKLKPWVRVIAGEDFSQNHFKDGEIALAVCFRDIEEPSFLSVPSKSLGRFLKLLSKKGSYRFIFLEDVLKAFAQDLFPDKSVASSYSIKVSRDAELYLEDEYEGDWIQSIYESLGKRQEGQPTRLLYEGTMPKEVQNKIRKLFGIGKVDMIKGGQYHNFSDFFSFPNPLEDKDLVFEPMPPLVHADFENCNDIFALVADRDRMLHFPYQSFGYLEKWVGQAAVDKNVTSIHISLYRIAKDSLLTTALLRALENGKEVIIFVEAKARFDEENNLKWGRTFEDKGAKVFYSFQNVKVHSKILLIERKEQRRLQGYAYIGTGNFNAKTSKIYCDHGLFTANFKITNDLKQVFKVLKREIVIPKLTTLLVSPYNSRLTFEHLIQYEMDQAVKGLPSGITAKMNSLEDVQMIDWLYKASNVGVKIKLLIRGFSCLRPNVPGLSENIVVTSIVDRFLEHARVFIFHNQGEEKMFMGSADWMTRNLDHRIEVLTPILEPRLFQQLKHIMDLQFSDTVKARLRTEKGESRYVKSKKDTTSIRSQYAIYAYLKGLTSVE